MTEPSPTATALLALMHLKGVGRRGALKVFGGRVNSPEEGLTKVLAYAARAGPPEAEVRTAWSHANAQLNDSAAGGIQAYALHDEGYPERLKRIPDPPAVLFVKGDPAALTGAYAVAVVGTREPTPYGEKVAQRLAETAAREGFVVVSGLAHGCDTLGHEGCLDGGGLGVAVLAHGLDRVYPAANRDLAQRLLDTGGCLVSEYPLGVTPARTAFAERDRIQSGLSDGVLVIETDVKGGTMHTVRFAGDQGRALACLQHPEKWRGEEKTRGNQQLIAERRATPIPDGDALLAFLARLKAPDIPAKAGKAAPESEAQHAWSF